MAKKPKPEPSKLVKALEYLSLLFKAGDDQSMYCNMGVNRAVAFNMVLAAGAPVEVDFTACPHTALFLRAIDECGKEYQVTQLSTEKLLVRSETWQAYIPCANPLTLSWPIPDAPRAPVDDRLTLALKKTAGVVDAKGETVVESSFQLQPFSCLATNRRVILQAWHGIDMPPGLLLPLSAAKILFKVHKAGKHLTMFGFSKETITFYFDDDTWLRSQLFQDRPVQIDEKFNCSTQERAVPQELFAAANKVAPFSATGSVFIKDGFVSSHKPGTVQQGSELKLPIQGEHAPREYFYADLRIIAPHVTSWDEISRQDATYFSGENLRGLIRHENFERTIDDSDIPF